MQTGTVLVSGSHNRCETITAIITPGKNYINRIMKKVETNKQMCYNKTVDSVSIFLKRNKRCITYEI